MDMDSTNSSVKYGTNKRQADSPQSLYLNTAPRTNSRLIDEAERTAGEAYRRQLAESGEREQVRRQGVQESRSQIDARLRAEAYQRGTSPVVAEQQRVTKSEKAVAAEARRVKTLKQAADIIEAARLASTKAEAAAIFLAGIEETQYVQVAKKNRPGPAPDSIYLTKPARSLTAEQCAERDQRQRDESKARAAAKNVGAHYIARTL